MFFFQYILYIYIYLYISIYIEKRKQGSAFFAFFYVLCKRTLRSFGFHKSPKTEKKNGKERNVQNGKERGAQPCLKKPVFGF